jgi:hypothetical protein
MHYLGCFFKVLEEVGLSGDTRELKKSKVAQERRKSSQTNFRAVILMTQQ